MAQKIIAQIHKTLVKRGKTIAVAESCSGGICSLLLTSLSGSSKYFLLGIITYSNASKIKILGIPASLIKTKGAVSKETALTMAQSVRLLADSDYAISITGIAGPTGATPGKPVGTVFIGIAGRNKAVAKKYLLRGNRSTIRKQAAFKCLSLLNTFLG